MAISAVFNVMTDYLLKSSEIDDLSVKTEMLEKQQQMMLGVLGGQEILFAEFLIATAIVVFMCVKKLGKKQE